MASPLFVNKIKGKERRKIVFTPLRKSYEGVLSETDKIIR